jgi:hypothetical protein
MGQAGYYGDLPYRDNECLKLTKTYPVCWTSSFFRDDGGHPRTTGHSVITHRDHRILRNKKTFDLPSLPNSIPRGEIKKAKVCETRGKYWAEEIYIQSHGWEV